MKTLSRSVTVMFLFDFTILSLSTFFVTGFFGFPPVLRFLSIFLITVTGLVSLFLKGNYGIREFNPTLWNIYRLFEGVIIAHVPAVLVLFFPADKSDLFGFLGLNIIIVFLLLLIYRDCFHYYLFRLKKAKNVLILGADERARIIADEIQSKYALKMNVAAFVKEKSDEDELIQDTKVPIYVEPVDLAEIIKRLDIDTVVIAQPTEMILSIPKGIKIYKMPDFYEMVTGKYYIDEKTITELYYQFMTQDNRLYDFCKRIYDIVAALIILTVTLPITGYIAIRVKLTDGASPFFTQRRVGKNGKVFNCYKLRTMYVNDYVPKDGDNVKYAESVKGDDRIIPFCRFIRKARFDEIPQMINILKGDMSIVGPRAEWENEVQIFKKQIPFYSCRMWVKTGWTGWSHINMNPVFTVEEERERLEHDLYYIKHRNVLWEIGILIKAVFLALGGRHK